ncbi:hypothetical protein [Paraburkholderia dinghuensis]|uniref:Uncharacterized protein n=1 Tax=Paraburkholderia dinghuensis TaxID=2305225 RepID=A0A3N6PL65_9BURK|nr:hypothetical protein [Paraburkholderia dinghuensis]RQH02130.1 hypothetical protein D1Y85_22840 [Paraburkholderia dinghuensis]
MDRLLRSAFVAGIVLASSPAHCGQGVQQRVVLSCPLAGGDSATLKVKPSGYEAEDVLVEIKGKTERAFPDDNATSGNDHLVLSACAHGTLIFAVEYGPPYRKGIAIRENPLTKEIERLHFSEKALPLWLYADEKGMLLVIPNEGYETDKKYLVYSYVSGKGEPDESTPMNKLPKPMRELTRIPSH